MPTELENIILSCVPTKPSSLNPKSNFLLTTPHAIYLSQPLTPAEQQIYNSKTINYVPTKPQKTRSPYKWNIEVNVVEEDGEFDYEGNFIIHKKKNSHWMIKNKEKERFSALEMKLKMQKNELSGCEIKREHDPFFIKFEAFEEFTNQFDDVLVDKLFGKIKFEIFKCKNEKRKVDKLKNFVDIECHEQIKTMFKPNKDENSVNFEESEGNKNLKDELQTVSDNYGSNEDEDKKKKVSEHLRTIIMSDKKTNDKNIEHNNENKVGKSVGLNKSEEQLKSDKDKTLERNFEIDKCSKNAKLNPITTGANKSLNNAINPKQKLNTNEKLSHNSNLSVQSKKESVAEIINPNVERKSVIKVENKPVIPVKELSEDEKKLNNCVKVKEYLSQHKCEVDIFSLVKELRKINKRDGLVLIEKQFRFKGINAKYLLDLLIRESKIKICKNVDLDGFEKVGPRLLKNKK